MGVRHIVAFNSVVCTSYRVFQGFAWGLKVRMKCGASVSWSSLGGFLAGTSRKLTALPWAHESVGFWYNWING